MSVVFFALEARRKRKEDCFPSPSSPHPFCFTFCLVVVSLASPISVLPHNPPTPTHIQALLSVVAAAAGCWDAPQVFQTLLSPPSSSPSQQLYVYTRVLLLTCSSSSLFSLFFTPFSLLLLFPHTPKNINTPAFLLLLLLLYGSMTSPVRGSMAFSTAATGTAGAAAPAAGGRAPAAAAAGGTTAPAAAAAATAAAAAVV